MSMPNECLELWFAKSHHEDLIREARGERMVREAQYGRVQPARFYSQMLRWMEQRLKAGRSSPRHETATPARASPRTSSWSE